MLVELTSLVINRQIAWEVMDCWMKERGKIEQNVYF